jgi:hypothetical protein
VRVGLKYSKQRRKGGFYKLANFLGGGFISSVLNHHILDDLKNPYIQNGPYTIRLFLCTPNCEKRPMLQQNESRNRAHYLHVLRKINDMWIVGYLYHKMKVYMPRLLIIMLLIIMLYVYLQ